MRTKHIVVVFRAAWDMPLKVSSVFPSIVAAEKWARNRKFVEWTIDFV